MKFNRFYYVLAIIFVLIFFIWIVRAFSERQIDDVSPGVSCEKELLKKVDVLYVIPKFNNQSISKEWCDEILALNKTLAMHGVVHSYNEFDETRSKEYVQEGREIFKECFGFYPERFKAPQLKISQENIVIVKKTMKLDNYVNEIFHKIYHCSDTGLNPNKLINWI
jgi:hypothetical protein